MSLNQRISIDGKTWVAMCALWPISALAGISFGCEWGISIAVSFVFTLLTGISFCTFGDKREEMCSPVAALIVLGVGALMTGLFFAIDCLNGYFKIPHELSLSRCVSVPTMFGFPLTSMVAGIFVFLAALIFLRMLAAGIWQRDG